MSAFRFGPDAGLPAGFAVCPIGTLLLRGHSPGREPAWFGPAVGAHGSNRFDLALRERASDPGVCYLSPTLEGVLLERVIRDVRRDVLSITNANRQHALTRLTTTRDLLLIDLLRAPWIPHGVQVRDVMNGPPYDATQRLAERLSRVVPDGVDGAPPSLPDGIVYASRFGAAIECLALWNRASDALDWHDTTALGSDETALAAACLRLGIGLLP